MAGPGATPDASPSATVLLLAVAISVVPGVEEACRVSGDALLEGQQGIPLVRYAGWAANILMSCRLSLLLEERMRIGDHGEEAAGGGGQDEQQVLGG